MALQRPSIRRLFLAAFIILPLQYALVGLVGLWRSEPWPALVMPGFQKVYRPDSITADVYRFEVRFADGSRASMSPTEVLADLPRSHHDAVMKLRFRAAASPPSETTLSPTLAAWLRQRVRSRYPTQTPVRVTVIRSEVLVVSDATAARRHVRPLDSLTVALR